LISGHVIIKKGEIVEAKLQDYFDDAKEFQISFKMNFKDEESKMSSKAKISTKELR